MINTIKEDTILHSIDTGQFSVVKLDTDNRYTRLISIYPKQFHKQITYAFRLNSKTMIKELMSYAEVFDAPVIHTVL